MGVKTKDKILEESLELFSKRGYNDVGIREIAANLGIRDSSLYKHFSGKRAIFDALVDGLSERMEALTGNLGIIDATRGDSSESFVGKSDEEMRALSVQIFLFYLKDPYVSRCRRMMAMEQYSSSYVGVLYRRIFLEDSITYQTLVFRQMMDSGEFPGKDPEVMALHFYSPIFFLLSRYDNQPEKEEEAIRLLERHVSGFLAVYRT